MSGGTDFDSTQRFSDRVADYVRYRPGYPGAAFDYLIERCRLSRNDPIVDVGAGTGLSSEPWLQRGFQVQAVEPNAPMRSAAACFLRGYPKLALVGGTAEALPLRDGSASLISASQAFHWFDLKASRQEFKRVLKPHGHVALIWNERVGHASPFLHGFEEALQAFACDYHAINDAGRSTQRITAFFAPGLVSERRFDHRQAFDFEGLCGRVRSSSYAPPEGHPNHAPLRAELRRLFERCASRGQVHFIYRTRVFSGQLR